MSGAIVTVLFFVGIILVILIHEGGHYLVARAFGFKVEEYFVGFGPELWATSRGGIRYGIKALPVGGYVKIAGMNPYEPVQPRDLPRAYGSKPRWQRALVIAAGPASHIVVGLVVFVLSIAIFGQIGGSAHPVVGAVKRQTASTPTPAFLAGLEPGDRILSAGSIEGITDDQLRSLTTSHIGVPVAFTILRGGQIVHTTMTPQAVTFDGQRVGQIGIYLAPEHVGATGWVTGGLDLLGRSVSGSFQAVGDVFGPHGISRIFELLFTNTQRQVTDPTSVVGVGQVVDQTASAGQIGGVLQLFGFVVVFIGLVNLIPLPPFDGGHIAVLVIEQIRGKAIDLRELIPVSAVVIAFLVIFVGATILADVMKPLSAGH
jgi:membrane-associated protease RseP (regulator of RpoE activity)